MVFLSGSFAGVKSLSNVECSQSWKLRRTQNISSFGVFYKEGGGRLWRVSYCEELVGLLTGDHGVGCGGISTWSIK